MSPLITLLFSLNIMFTPLNHSATGHCVNKPGFTHPSLGMGSLVVFTLGFR